MGDLALSATSSSSRIYGPVDFRDDFHTPIRKDEIRPVLAKIKEIYSCVKLDKETLQNGLSFGLLDPGSNIVINSVISETVSAPQPREGGGKLQDGDMNQRSFDGLVAFLTTLFPYLPRAEATLYLDAAGADPLVAALLIIDRRRMRRISFCSGTTVAAVETALRCAAAASRHPDPQQLVLGWKRLSPHLKNLVSELPSTSRTEPGDAVIRRMLTRTKLTTTVELQLEQSWGLASSRCVSTPIPEALPPVMGAMKRMLLATIHRFYLEALARLPTGELRARYHRSLLMGGYCYGPLDPVSNIIVNTLWYEHHFPVTSKQVTLEMISTKCLWRVAARSLYGLVSFLCTRYADLTPDLAMQRLQASRANLHLSDPNLCTYDVDEAGTAPSASIAEAYVAAATAACHTNPLVQQEFLGSPDALPKMKLASEAMQDGRQLSSRDLESISTLLRPSSVGNSLQQQETPAPLKLKRWAYSNASHCVLRFWEQHERVSTKVKAALDTYNKNMVAQYRLHVICGVNELVSGPAINKDRRDCNPRNRYKYHHSHVNFLATCQGDPPTLFFAECINDSTDDKSCWCVPVSSSHQDANVHPEGEQVRCIYCESEANRIVHPAMKGFHGRDIEFERVLRGEAPFPGPCTGSYTNDILASGGGEDIVDWVYDLPDDSIYTNFCIADDDDGDPMDHVRRIHVC